MTSALKNLMIRKLNMKVNRKMEIDFSSIIFYLSKNYFIRSDYLINLSKEEFVKYLNEKLSILNENNKM